MRSLTPNQFLDALLYTIAISGLSCVRPELFHLPAVPSLAHHSEQTNRQFSGHGLCAPEPSGADATTVDLGLGFPSSQGIHFAQIPLAREDE
jgi:hypothetical protein